MAGLYSDATLDQIRAASDIVDIIGSSLPLKRAGANFVALCPFHKEKTPSFNVNPQRQIFHCFGCHKGGDVFTFVKEYENITFPEAVRRLAERARIPLEVETDPGREQNRFVKETLLKIHEQITQRWQTALANDAAGQIARDYLARRGVPEEAITLFRLGYAPDAWDDTVNWAKSKSHELPVVEQAGLILRKEGGDHYYDRFRGRLIFPICDEQGRVIGFSGRVLQGDEKTAKYVNSPETPIFTKGKVFFGLDKSKRALLDAGCAVVCEGQLDLIACYMAGVQNVVAPQGTALTAEHARILKRYVDEVVLCFDSDTAGRNATIRALDDLTASALAIRVAKIPSPHDPDSFIKEHGAEKLRELIASAQGFFEFYLDHLCAENDPAQDKGRLAIVKSMSEALHKTGSAVLVDTYAQKTANRLGVTPEAVRSEFKKAGRVSGRREAPDHEAPTDLPRPPATEFWLLKVALLHDELVEWIERNLDVQWITHPVVRRLVALRLESQRNGTWRGVAECVGRIDDDQTRNLLTEAVNLGGPIKDPSALLKGGPQVVGTVQRLRDEFISREIKTVQRLLADSSLPAERQTALVSRKIELQALKRCALQSQ